MEEQNGKLTYLMCDGTLYKIGKSQDPEKRLKQIRTGNPYVELICYGSGVTESYLHSLFFQKRKRGEWFDLSEENLEKCKRLIIEGEDVSKQKRNKTKEVTLGNYTFTAKIKKSKWNLEDKEVKKNIDAKKHSVDLNKKYVINFGKHKGMKISEMKTQEQYEYCEWFLKEYSKDMSRNSKTKDRKYKAFSWWVRLGYKEYMENDKA